MPPRDWNALFSEWWKPPSRTEEAKASRAASMINDAVRDTRILDGRDFTVYPTGSYRNNTNVRGGSDVDIAAVFKSAFFYELPQGVTREMVGIGSPPTYSFEHFKGDLHKALAAKFGPDAQPGNIAFDIAGNAGRLPADVTAFLPHRRYTQRADGTFTFVEGVETRSAGGTRRIINWHQEHYTNGVARNDATKRRFKRVARILKRLKGDMIESGTPEAKAAAAAVSSFLIESLVFNAPDTCFNKEEGSYVPDVRAVVAHCRNETKDDEKATKLVEVNRMKLLFGTHQKWTRDHAHAFLLRAWNHAGFAS